MSKYIASPMNRKFLQFGWREYITKQYGHYDSFSVHIDVPFHRQILKFKVFSILPSTLHITTSLVTRLLGPIF